MTRVALHVTSAIMKILQTYYPELLHKCIWWHAPAAFNAVWAVVKPFVDSVTAAKIVLLAKRDKTSQEQLNAMCVPPCPHARRARLVSNRRIY